jgi:tRNA A-37 threonylcarbamoyl transferase component Bud32
LSSPEDGATRLESDRSGHGVGLKPGSASSGWLSTSDAIDHGRFPPGTLLGGRYRIVGRLGRGGMGEVYRADDLKLAQPVALKFLPAEVDHDPARLMQLHSEVRMARQVSHPNVCRVYDIDEVDGHTFLSMEYVDGEELGSLLRRIGRFPAERALEMARQLCAGLAAAHERGVIHRDLKPANVMLDGAGKVRITDFGLAGATGETVRAGTPAYMAPEQLAGSEVTAQSDIYALGLVMAEWQDQKLRLEAAAYRGRIVSFQTIYPWTEPSRMRETNRSVAEVWIQGFIAVAVLVVLSVATFVARHNLRKGRGDRRGVLRIAAAIFSATLLAWVIGATHFPDANTELNRFFLAIGEALFSAAALWILYLALEPYVRKFWPSTLISWSRLLAGHIVDAQVGRDVLIGVGAAAAVNLLGRLHYVLGPWLGYPDLPPAVPRLFTLEGASQTLAAVSGVLFSAAFNALWIVFGLVAINLIARRVWITALVMTGFLLLTSASGIAETPPIWLGVIVELVALSALVFVMLRFGLLPTLVFFFCNFLLSFGAYTLDASKWFFQSSTLLLLIPAALAIYGFYASRGGEPLLGRRILD